MKSNQSKVQANINKISSQVTVYVVVCFLIGFAFLFVLLPKHTVSQSERRKLAQIPELTIENIANETFMEDLESYLLDHFPLRDSLRRLKSYFAYNMLVQRENNDIYVVDGHACKVEHVLNENSVKKTADKIVSLKETYFPNANVYYAVVPDKNTLIAPKHGYPYIDYDSMTNILQEKLNGYANIKYIDIYDTIKIEDYYTTDTHWKQECILDTAFRIASALGVEHMLNLSPESYNIHEIKDFYGVYSGQSALILEPDVIKYMTNDAIDSATVWNVEKNKYTKVYDIDKLNDENTIDKYDVFLSGATAIQVIENNIKDKSPNEMKKLIIFRDSFTSSLAPILIEAYDEIVLIDLRYVSSALLGDYVDFTNADVLFLYNMQVVNNSSMLR